MKGTTLLLIHLAGLTLFTGFMSTVQEPHCVVHDRLIILPGKYYFDKANCAVYKCRNSMERYAEIDEYKCLGMDYYFYSLWHRECVENDCPT